MVNWNESQALSLLKQRRKVFFVFCKLLYLGWVYPSGSKKSKTEIHKIEIIHGLNIAISLLMV